MAAAATPAPAPGERNWEAIAKQLGSRVIWALKFMKSPHGGCVVDPKDMSKMQAWEDWFMEGLRRRGLRHRPQEVLGRAQRQEQEDEGAAAEANREGEGDRMSDGVVDRNACPACRRTDCPALGAFTVKDGASRALQDALRSCRREPRAAARRGR